MKKFNKLLFVDLSVMTFLVFAGISCQVAMATQTEEQAVFQTLLSHGLKQVEVTISEKTVRIEYFQPYSEFKVVDEAAVRVAQIVHLVNQRLPGQRQVLIEQHFDDGQIVEVAVAAADAERFLKKELSTDSFLERVKIKPLTRGIVIAPELCEPKKGKNCENCEACICYPNEMCSPADPGANKRGCVAKYIPENAHLVGSEYVCNVGYKWNSDLTGCIELAGGHTNVPGWKPLVPTVPAGSVIGHVLLADSVPPSPWNQKNVFSPGDSIYVWVESKVLESPHTLAIVWNDPAGKKVKREQFDMRGWGASETHWSELKTSAATLKGQWQIHLLIDGRIEKAVAFLLQP